MLIPETKVIDVIGERGRVFHGLMTLSRCSSIRPHHARNALLGRVVAKLVLFGLGEDAKKRLKGPKANRPELQVKPGRRDASCREEDDRDQENEDAQDARGSGSRRWVVLVLTALICQ